MISRMHTWSAAGNRMLNIVTGMLSSMLQDTRTVVDAQETTLQTAPSVTACVADQIPTNSGVYIVQ